MKPLKSILSGIDFSSCSGTALKEAIRLARVHQATLTAIHVVDTAIALELEANLTQMQGEVRKGLIAEAMRNWKEFAQSIQGANTLEPIITIEHRTMALLRVVKEHHTDLLILGAHGHQRPDVGSGTVATGCVRHACCDVLLVRDTHNGPFGTVVAAVDFSETSRRAMERAAQIAVADGAKLHVVHIHALPWDPSTYRTPIPQADARFVERYKNILNEKLTDFARPIMDSCKGLSVTCALSDAGRHRSGIVEYADRLGADLICLGTRGWSNFRDMLLGSTAEKALLYSHCSVLAVKPEGFAESMCTR